MLWAVHISDGVLDWTWLGAGFLLAALLTGLAAWRVRDEEVPRIALLAAAFFVASLIHLRLGPTSVHLLLNGLVGVILGRRAPLAIVVGLALQAVLIGHGGFTSLGVNACVLTLPALLAGMLFRLLHRVRWVEHPACRVSFVTAGGMVWGLCLVFALALLFTNRWTGSNGHPLMRLEVGPALGVTFHPATLLIVGLLALFAAGLERRQGHAPEFTLGLLLGLLAVLATALLNALVLLWGGAEDWHTLVLLVFVAHLPVAALEGVVLGFTVSFLARVKPELFVEVEALEADQPVPELQGPHHPEGVKKEPAHSFRSSIWLLALLGPLALASPAHAHRLVAEYKVLPDGKVRIESWFDQARDSAVEAKVKVFRKRDAHLLLQGELDEEGLFAFTPPETTDLRILIDAGLGHHTEITVPRVALTGEPDPDAGEDPPTADRSSRVSFQDVLLGVTFLLALGAFIQSLRNGRRLRALDRGERGP
jgi:cobalt/nickel transport system permease protein